MKAQKNVKEFSCQTMPKQNKTCFYATILGVMQSLQEFSKPVLAHVRAWKCLDGHVESKQLWSPIKRISVAFRFINFLVSTLKFGLSFRLGFSYMFFWFKVHGFGGLRLTDVLALKFTFCWWFRIIDYQGFRFQVHTFLGSKGSQTTSER